MGIQDFDWDSGNWPNFAKHGVSQEEIEQVLLGTPAVMADPFAEEPRMRAIGRTSAGRYVFLLFMPRQIRQPNQAAPSAPASYIRRRSTTMKAKPKAMPSLDSDDAAEEFLAMADLTKFDLSSFKPMRFEIEPKSAALNMRLPASLLEALKAKAKAQGVPYTRYVRMLLEIDVARVG